MNRFLALCAVAAVATFAPVPAAFAGGEGCANCSAAKASIRQASLQEVRAIASGKQKGVIIDSRSGYAYKQGHIPGAISLPVDDAHDSRLPKDKNTLLVFYCGAQSCGLSTEGAEKAVKLGYKKVAVYKGGLREWQQASAR